MENAYMTFEGKIRMDVYSIIIGLWDKFIEEEGSGNKIFYNNKEFFENSFENEYDVAMAVSLSKQWRWTDDFVFFDSEGYLTSFSRCEDETCPIDFDKIDIGYLIRGLQDLQEEKSPHKNRYVINNIPRAIHDALKE